MIWLERELAQRVQRRLTKLYGLEAAPRLAERFRLLLGRYGVGSDVPPLEQRWTENDTLLITYGDSIRQEGEVPLQTLHHFLCEHGKGALRTIHILPFYPWTSDDGFSVVDYRAVDSRYGSWRDIERLGADFDLMFDVVLNHCSAKSEYFEQFVTGEAPGSGFFHEVDPDTDLSAVVRPRALPLLTPTSTRDGVKHVWTTFSADQVDLNWANPDVLFEFLDIFIFYLSKGARIFRLDAVAFLWKTLGTNCLHLPETHEVIKLIRDLLEVVSPQAIVLTETNVPHEENMSYFGDGDEAHMVYNFTLPPLLLHGLLREDATRFTEWAKSLPDLPDGQTFLNFTSSHDGIGVRPLEGMVEDAELTWLVDEVRRRDGRVSMRSVGKEQRPYELNITYADALRVEGDEALGIKRFLCSQAIALAFRGIPAIYIHSLLGTRNDLAAVEETGINRRINRHSWDLAELRAILDERGSRESQVFDRYLTWLHRRENHPAFHPEAPMEIADLGPTLLGLIRRSKDGQETIACVFNFTARRRELSLAKLDPSLDGVEEYRDILAGKRLRPGKSGRIRLEPFAAHWFTAN